MKKHLRTAGAISLGLLIYLVYPPALFALSPAESLDCNVDLTLPANQWQQISLPCNPSSANTVAEIIGDDIPGTYRQDWILFAFDHQTNRYSDPGENGILVTGVGYWVIQTTGNDIQLNIKGQTLIPSQYGPTPQCPFIGGCIEIPLPNNETITWTMLGQPLLASLEWTHARIRTDTGICADTDGCTLLEAENENIFHPKIWHYRGNEYQTIEGKYAINFGEGFWAATLGAADNPRLILPIEYGGYTPQEQGIAGFFSVDDRGWNETAVRQVLHTFAFGGHATEAQIQAWSHLSPATAIVQMLSFDAFNPLLSPPLSSDSANLAEKGGTLRELGTFWSSSDADNDVDELDRKYYDVSPTSNFVYNDRLFERAVLSRGTNPFRQKVGLWETNYHLATNLNSDVTDWQMIRYYDDILESLNDPQNNYADTLTTAALSAAIAEQYGHDKNVYRNEGCQCNEDFAREYHQLFFGILGEDDPQYHETVTIKNTAKALTDMKIIYQPEISEWADFIHFSSAEHWPGTLEILQTSIAGSQADQRISTLSQIAIQQPESLHNLPVKIIRGLANDTPSNSDLTEIRNVWNDMGEKSLLKFLRGYAISTQFHSNQRIKYTNSFDRNLTALNQTILNNYEINIYGANTGIYAAENVALFKPKHNVFGGQTGAEAATSSDIFRLNYNRATDQNWNLSKYSNTAHDWLKNWASRIPSGQTDHYQVDKVGEFLWNRYIGDGLKNYGVLERTYVNAFLATNGDWAAEVNPHQLEQVFSTNSLISDSNLITQRQAHAKTTVSLNDSMPVLAALQTTE